MARDMYVCSYCVIYICDWIMGYNLRVVVCFLQAEDGIRDLVRSRGLGDVYKRQVQTRCSVFSCLQPVFLAPKMCRSAATRMLVEPQRLSLIHI